MESPYYENGAQATVTIEELPIITESFVIRFILYQPSPQWKEFSIKSIKAFAAPSELSSHNTGDTKAGKEDDAERSISAYENSYVNINSTTKPNVPELIHERHEIETLGASKCYKKVNMPTLSTWIQCLRNFLCVFKSVVPIAYSTFLYTSIDVSAFVSTTSDPTLLELLIAVTQLAAVVLNIQDGVWLISKAFILSKRLKTCLKVIERNQLNEPSTARIIVQKGMVDSLTGVYFCAFEGLLQVVFGIAFTFLAMNSLHIHGPTHPKPLIDALIAMEIGLVYFLFKMWNAFWAKYKIADTYISLIGCIHAIEQDTSVGFFLNSVRDIEPNNPSLLCNAIMTLNAFHEPLWHNLNSFDMAEDVVDIETRHVEATLAAVMCREPDDKVRLLQARGAESLQAAPLEFLFFALNFVAGYGYLLGILAFYCPEHTYGSHVWFRILTFGLTNDSADWWGNLAGDAAWTIEPLLIILLSYSTPTASTVEPGTDPAPTEGGGSRVQLALKNDDVVFPSPPPTTRKRRVSIKT